MKITKSQLRQIIKEELNIKLLNEWAPDPTMSPPRSYSPAPEPAEPAYRGEVGFGDWDTMAFDDPKVAAAMKRVKNHLNKFVEDGTFKKAAAESGVSERLIYGTVFDELMRSTPTTGAIEKVIQGIDDDPKTGTALATITDWTPFVDRKEPAVGIASIKPQTLFGLINAGYLDDMDIPEAVRGGSTRAALDWIHKNPEASIQVVAARHKKKRDDWSNLKDSGRDIGWEPDEATLAQMYSMDDTPPQTRAQRAAINKDKGWVPGDENWKAPDPTGGSRGKRVVDIWGHMGYPDLDLRTSPPVVEPVVPEPEPDWFDPDRFSSIDETLRRWEKLIK